MPTGTNDSLLVVFLSGLFSLSVVILTKLAEGWIARSKTRAEGDVAFKSKELDDAAAIRKELREQVKELRADIAKVEADLDSWKERYFKLLGQYTELQQKYDEVLKEVEELRERVNARDAKDQATTK